MSRQEFTANHAVDGGGGGGSFFVPWIKQLDFHLNLNIFIL